MRGWLNIELVLGILLVTSFTSVGLIALWAATSPRHWFLRIAALVAFLAPLLMIRAYELFLIFAFESALIVFVIVLGRRGPWNKANWKWPRVSISVGGALLGTAII